MDTWEMNNAKHTPGPWSVAYLDLTGQVVIKGEHSEVCTCWHHYVSALEKQMHHNARLIAAAPEMLDALERLKTQVKEIEDGERPYTGFDTELIDAVIAKAKGE